MKKKFHIKYRVLFNNEETLENKEMKIANCMNAVHAQIRLEEHLQKKFDNFKQLIVSECKEDLDIFSQFGDIFGDQGGNSWAGMFGGKN